MAGCYGNSAEDRYFESMCDKYTDEHDEDYCDCEHERETNEAGIDLIKIDGDIIEFSDLYDTDRDICICTICEREIEEI